MAKEILIDRVATRMRAAGRDASIPQVEAVLRGKQPLRRGVPVEVERAEGRKAPNGAEYHVRIKASTAVVARDGGLVPLDAWANGGLRYFELNPVIQFAHNYRTPPIGISVYNEISREEGALIEYWLFHEENEESTLMKKLYERGFMRAASVGFLIHDWVIPTSEEEVKKLQKQYGVRDDIMWVATRTELLETSAVPVPADPLALSLQHAVENGRAHGVDIGNVMRHITERETMTVRTGAEQAAEEEVAAPVAAATTTDGVEQETPNADVEAGVVTEEVTTHQSEEPNTDDAAVQRVAEMESRLATIEARLEAIEAAHAEGDKPAGTEEERSSEDGETQLQVEIEVKEGETPEEAVARFVDEQVQRLTGAPVR